MKWIWPALLLTACAVASHPSDGGVDAGSGGGMGGGGTAGGGVVAMDAGGGGGAGGGTDAGTNGGPDPGACGGFGGGNESFVQTVPLEYDFGDVVLGESLSAEIDIVSSMTAFGHRMVGSDASAFTLQQLRCSPVVFPKVCTWALTFTPQHQGPALATLDLGNFTAGSCMPLSGNGVAAAGLRLSPAVVQLDAMVGSSSSWLPVTLTNARATPSGPLLFAVTGAYASWFKLDAGACPASLDAGESCTASVHFGPNAQRYDFYAPLEVSAQPGGKAVAELSGSGLAPAALTFSGEFNYAFASFDATRAGTIANAGDLPTGALSSPVLSGLNATSFAIVDEQCTGVALNAGATCPVTVTLLSDADGGAGARDAYLSISSADGLDASVHIYGSAY